MFQLPREPQNALAIIANGYRFWKSTFRKVWLLSFIVVLMGTLPFVLIPQLNTHNPHQFIHMIEHNMLVYALFLLLTLFLFVVLLYRTHMLLHHLDGGVGLAMLTALKRLPYVIIGVVFYQVAVMAGLLLLIIPGIVIMVLLSVYLPLIIVDHKNPIAAFKASWLLITDQWFHTFFVVIMSALIIYIVIIPIDWFAVCLWAMAYPKNDHIWMARHVLRIISGTLLYPFSCSILLLLLHDLKSRTPKILNKD